MKGIFQKIIAACLILVTLFVFVACSQDNNEGNNENGGAGNIDIDDINDAFVDIKFNEIEVTESNVTEISVQEILLNTVEVSDIEVLDIELTTINDEFVYLAYKNFVDYYGVDIDWNEFIKDVAIGGGAIIVMVTLSTVAGPIGTFFGGVIASEFAASALIIGTALDAAVAGYKAYRDGGDLTYVLGHMLQGVGEGFKFSAILAPLTGSVAGIKALKAVSQLRKVPGFENITHKQASELLKNAAKMLELTKGLTKEATDAALKELYRNSAESIAKEISEDLFIQAFKAQDAIISIMKSTNAFNLSKELLKTLRNNFMSKAGVSEEVGKALIKKLKNHSIKTINDIGDEAVRTYIEKNVGEFVELFGKAVKKDFVESLIERKVGKEVADTIMSLIAKSKNAYSEIVEKIGKSTIDDILSNADSLLLLQSRYGYTNVIKLLNTKKLYNCLLQDNQIPEKAIKKIIDGFMDGTIKTVDDVAKINKQAAKNIRYSEALAQALKDLGLGKRMSDFIDGLVVDKMMMHVSNDIVSSATMQDIVKNRLTKSKIVSRYGSQVYNELVDKARFLIGACGSQNNVNKTLINEILQDVLSSKNVAPEAISRIMKGMPVSAWGVSDDVLKEAWQTIGLYYKALDQKVYDNFVGEIAESRGEWIKSFIKEYEQAGNTIRNKAKFAGKIMEPTGSNAKYIKAKYGDIYMSEAGFVIFDQHSIAVYVSDGLTGANGGMDDIIRANLSYFGVQSTPKGYTWHHLEDGKTMILIPTELHDAYRHTGGADLIREGLKQTA